MKQEVRLRIGKFMDGDYLEAGAMVEVLAIEQNGRGRRIERVPVPVGEDPGRYRSVKLDPGRYEFEGFLPSGEIVSRTVDIQETPVAQEIVLDGGSSPHESMAWQHLFGNVPGRRAPARRRVPQGRLGGVRYAAVSARDMLSPARFEAEICTVPCIGQGEAETVSRRLGVWLEGLDPSTCPKDSRLFPPEAGRWRVQVKMKEGCGMIGSPSFDGIGQDVRVYVQVGDGRGHAILCTMPYPWEQTDGNGRAAVEAVVAEDEGDLQSESGDTVPGWSVRPGVRDRRIGAVLSYFASGEAMVARELIEPARGMLFEKFANPIAAAGGGYVLLADWVRKSSAGREGSVPPWFTWIDNLCKSFPWLPDGAILQGCLALWRSQPSPLGTARNALLEAERRGIPYYTAGVRQLCDGLLVLAGEARRRGRSDRELEDAVARVRRISWQVDPRQVFTCIRLHSC
jgi:hypothetical protein